MNTIRQQYLKNEWNQYPFLKEKVFTVRDFVKFFAKLNAGAKKLKTQEFWLAGRITQTQSTDGFRYTISSQEESLELEFAKTCKLSEKSSNDEIFASGDQVLIQGFWNEVQVEGFEVRIQRVKAHQVQLLAPCQEIFNIDNFNYKKSKQWQFFLQQIRKTFEVLDFTEVHTPSLLPAPGTEPFLDFFKTEFKMGSQKKTFYLPTSPELHLKKMISAGWCRIFEIKNCFRNGEVSEHHQPEFWMLEWYRAYDNLDSLVKDIQGILNFLKLHWPEPIVGHGPLKQVTIAQLFQDHCHFDLTPRTSKKELEGLAQKLSVELHPTDTWNDIFFKIFLEKIEKNLGFDQPTIVRNYPPSQAALARLTPEGWADRFEFYWKGIEIANAFHELNDPEEQLKRFKEEISFREKHRGETIPMDENFIKALQAGFPPTAGIALGLDRLFMAVTNLKDISKTRAFYI
jgi:lysyl-tRNA synthetase class 2